MTDASVLNWRRTNGEREPLPAAPFQIGPYRVDPSALLITDGVNPQRVERKVMEVLLCLVERQGETVAHETLFEEAWQDNFVSDSVLHRAISVLRSVFGDNPREPRYIETIPRVGYRLLQPVEWEEPNQRPDLARQRKSVVRWRLIAILAAVGAVAAHLATFMFMRQQRMPLSEVSVRPVTAMLGYEFDPAITADGQWLAYMHIESLGGDHQGGLYVASVEDTSQPRLLAAVVENERYPRSPAWSPDGNRLAWIDNSETKPSADGTCSIQIQPLAADAPTKTYGCNESTSLDWSPDGARLLVNDTDSEGHARIREIDLRSRDSQWLTNPPTGLADTKARYSPDGKRIAVVRGVAALRSFIVILDRSGREIVEHDPGFVNGLDWWNEDELILSKDGTSGTELWRLRLSDGHLDRLAETQGGDSPAVAGNRILFMRETFDGGIWAYDLRGKAVEAVAPSPFIVSTHWDRHPQISPDGLTTSFVSDRSGMRQVWIAHADGAETMVSRLETVDWIGPPRWSPDGGSLVFESHSEDGFRVHVANLATDSVESVELPFDVIREPSWAPDGRLVVSAPIEGVWQLWIRTEGGTWDQLTDNGGLVSAPGPYGDWVYYTKYGVDGLWRRPFDGGPEELVIDWLLFADRRNWALTRDAIVAVRSLPEGRRLVRVSDAGTESLVEVDDIVVYGVSATDSIACYGRGKATGSDLYLLQPTTN